MTSAREIAPAKLNLALHVRGKLPDGRHAIETLFVFCTDGDRLTAERADSFSLELSGPFADGLSAERDNLVWRAAEALRESSGGSAGAAIRITKNLPVAAGLGGGSADAAAALRLLTSLWNIDPRHAEKVAPALGSDVPACLLSLPARGEGAGDRLTHVAVPEVSGASVLLVNPRVPLSTSQVFGCWDGVDGGPLGNWREGRNDLQGPAIKLVPQIESVLAWLALQSGVTLSRMSGSGSTFFAVLRDHASGSLLERRVKAMFGETLWTALCKVSA